MSSMTFDQVWAWLDARCEPVDRQHSPTTQPGTYVGARDAFDDYIAWCADAGEQPFCRSYRYFTTMLERVLEDQRAELEKLLVKAGDDVEVARWGRALLFDVVKCQVGPKYGGRHTGYHGMRWREGHAELERVVTVPRRLLEELYDPTDRRSDLMDELEAYL